MGAGNTHTSHAMIYTDYIKACFNGSCLLLNDSKQSQKRQERESQYIMGFLIFLYRPSLESQTGFKYNGAVLVTWLDSVRGSTTHDALACKPLTEIEPSCYRKIGRRYEMCDSMGGKGRPWLP